MPNYQIYRIYKINITRIMEFWCITKNQNVFALLIILFCFWKCLICCWWCFHLSFSKCMCVCLVCFVYHKLLFLMRWSDSLSFSVYMKIFWRCFSTFLENVPEVRTIFVRNIFGDIWGIWGDLFGPKWFPTHPPTHPHPQPWRQCQRSLPG